jgi:L-ascorbate metabolism protein UlaG (beta-lactamase superfamily)
MDHAAMRRRTVLGAAAAAGVTLATGCGDEPGPSGSTGPPGPAGGAGRWRGPPGTSGVTLRWLGNNAWDIRFGDISVLVDPWLTRFRTGTYTAAGIRPDTPLTTDPAVIDRYVDRADLILVCHGHYDHMADVPYIASRTGAQVLGTVSHINTLRAMGVPAGRLRAVQGGLSIKYQGFMVEVVRSAHSEVGNPRAVPFPGQRPSVPARPRTVADLVEGGTLAYQITVDDRFRVLVLSSANFLAGEMVGLRPDLAVMPAGGGDLTAYADGLMRALDRPTWVLPSHWDDIDVPLSEPAKDWGALQPLRRAVAAANPGSTFVVLDHGQTFTP